MRTPAHVREHLVAVVLTWVESYPGIWTAAICRAVNGLPATSRSVAWCGLCADYANPRKRARAERLGPTLPGFEERGAFQLHGPCGTLSFRVLRGILQNLERDALMVVGQRSAIPDPRNGRGWDVATRWWPLDGWHHDRCPACGGDAAGDPVLHRFGRCARCHHQVEAGGRCPACLEEGHAGRDCPWMVKR